MSPLGHDETDHEHDDVVARAAALATSRRGSSGPPGPTAEQFVRQYYRHVSTEDFADRNDVDVYGAAMSHYRLAAERPQGTATVRAFTPTVAEHGWSADGHTVVEVVTDDMSFLVDSVTMELNEQGRGVHLVVHPQLLVRRDVTGALQEVIDDEGYAALTEADVCRESWMHVEIDREAEPEQLEEIEKSLRRVLSDVRESVEDWAKMQHQVEVVIEDLQENPPVSLDPEEVEQGAALLRWLAEDHFTFLGYREYRLEEAEGDTVLRAVAGTGLGILRTDQDLSSSFGKLPPLVREKAREKKLLVLAKANSKATVHRPVYLDYVGVKSFDENGEVVGERRFLGLYSSTAYTESLTRIPVVREKARGVLARLGADEQSHTGKALMDILENYPRDELFQTGLDELVRIAKAVLHTRDRRRLRLFVRPDAYHRYLSCLVYLPRDRYNTAVRERIAELLKEELRGSTVDYTARVGESLLARVHFVVRPERGRTIDVDVDVPGLERRIAEAARSWQDDFASAVREEYGEATGARLARRYGGSFPEAYKEDYPPRTGAVDLGRLEGLCEGADDGAPVERIALSFYQPVDSEPTEARLKVYRVGPPLSLSHVLPILSTMGVEVVDERPYQLDGLGRPTYIYDFGLRHSRPIPDDVRELFQDAVAAVWEGRNEADGFNGLVLAAGLTWRQATVLRAYAKYMRQGGTPFAQDYIEDALKSNLDITRLLVQLFETRFDPAGPDEAGRDARAEALTQKALRALDEVVSLDQDRILRSYLTVIGATLRTNYFQKGADGAPKPYISFKFRPDEIPELPQPRPRFEIFVYSPRVEGVHLRFGAVARGGLRWSDRRDDFRTEVLGLVKAQMVKNTVIVPVGAKGGFFCKQLPDPSDREAWMEEGKACYRTFIRGLLDITDNLVDGENVPPPDVVRRDGDDSYLVVAADKGTATFSDIANAVAAEYGFWLGDAFASGGSAGYDHKAMGITARGAWESVKRHFRERGIDCQSEDFTCVGIGDMSGDVFGNGMLLSEHIRLVAAFDHRDIFLDPDPDAATSYAERRRLFELPRSSWQDYDKEKISTGGGVWSRRAKSVPIGDEVRRALDLPDGTTKLTPNELIRAILQAPVDLLWNGGIGTYVKSEVETHADVGDKANDAIRVNGSQLRCAAVGEGGNLGLTQLGRIEYARRGCGGEGGRINTDFIDNSAGVDTSDHEVNIKILLDRVVRAGDLTGKQRNQLLASMTDEVAGLVLKDNYEQNIALATAAWLAEPLLHVHEDWMCRLERQGYLDRRLEFLPSSEEVSERLERGEGLTVPELSTLLAYTKIVLAEDLLESGLPDDPFLVEDLHDYFPEPLRQRYADQVDQHPLRREIVVTQAVNALVNGAGVTFYHRLSEETGASAEELVRANFVAREIFGSRAFVDEVYALDNQLDAAVQIRMRIVMRTLVERATRWLVNNRRPPVDSRATVEFYRGSVERLMKALPELLSGRELAAYERRRDEQVARGVPEELAERVAVLPPAYALLTVVDTAERDGFDPLEVARVHFALGDTLGLSMLVDRILVLPRDDRWQTMARAALRDDLHAVHSALTAQVLADTPDDAPVEERIATWMERDEMVVRRAAETLRDICGEEKADLARLSVGLRVVRTLLSGLAGA
ncbi:NAD-glutamate dehydrogenase [Nocardioides caldifontis]|uniref:NAD-glutamate dehydrogenase n=1 Tax=Nocardioides caldifontis TaxID=2588938 RepID=UPI001EF136D3|nr:NAD-glutamate dehydrogenase [Nocardioides caldifontis]